MPKKNSDIEITDGFCGAGGSAQGAKNAGAKIRIGLNHWKLATETYGLNNPDTDVDCTDISACDPRRYPSTEGAIFSPECTTHSPAGGNTHRTLKKQMDMFNTGKIDAGTERSRATMWDVCRFAEYHQYSFIVVENVVEAKTRWVLFDDWLRAMHTLGYSHKCCYHNSMHYHPTPQSRDRMYIVFWKKGNKVPMLDHTPLANCSNCKKNVESVQTWKNQSVSYGKYRQQYVYCCPKCTKIVEPYYYAAFNCIDWSDLGTRIGDRKFPLKPMTIKRIEFGRNKFKDYPIVIKLEHSQRIDNVRPVNDTLSTQTVRQSMMLINPFIIKGEHSLLDPMVRGVDESLQTQLTRQTMSLLTPPFLTEMYSHGNARKITDPINTVTAGGGKTGLVTSKAFQSFVAQYYNGSDCVKHITEAIGTCTTNDRSGLFTYNMPELEDCYYRMLKPPEVKLAMAFDSEYKILGSGKDQVRQLGNAVTPPAMEFYVSQCIKSIS